MRKYPIINFPDSIKFDSLSIIPASVVLTSTSGKIISSSYYHINYAKAILVFDKKKLKDKVSFSELLMDTLVLSYRVFPYDFAKTYQHKDIKLYQSVSSNPLNPFAFKYEVKDDNADLFKMEGLNKSGSISRGVMFGNNQDLSVNSNLNLNLSGKVHERFSIMAAVTDNNIPIQPDGNTQQLQNFDQVYIQLFDDKTKITAGDFQLTKPNSYFMNFYKRAQGANFSTSSNIEKEEKKGRLKASASAAVSKGKFARNVIQGVEGNQGPYRLKGSENETFIIVLSGTETVFIDGRQLLRGQENDYVVDYNTAGITFTAKQLITKDKRIIVEFQYSDKNYARSLIHYSNEFESQKLKLRLNIYSEQDAKNQPLQQELDDEMRLKLSNIGDSVNEAIFPAIDSVEFNTNEVLYKRLDTLVNGSVYDSVFVYSTNQDSAFYRLAFSLVGQGRGNYKQAKSTANGKVFEWVAPVNGIPQGNYEPVILLVTPRKRQMLAVGGEYLINKHTKTNIELAYSNYDVNTFSEKGNSDNGAFAIKTGIENSKPIAGSEEKPVLMNTFFNYEQVNQNFTQIERFRSIEFERDWNVLDKKISSSQFLTSSGLGFSKKDLASINYGVQTFSAIDEYKGIKNVLSGGLTKNNYDFSFSGSYMTAEGEKESSDFFRQKSKISKKLKYITIGVWEDQEINKRYYQTDSLMQSSYQYLEWESFVSNPDTFKNKFNLSYKQRYDKLPSNNQLHHTTFGESYNAAFGFMKNPNSVLNTSSTLRKLTITNSNLTSLKPENTLLNRIEYNLKLLKGTFTTSVFYEIGSGLELKREFSFLEVPAGQGVYAYIGDLNENGAKDLNEFEIAPLPDMARYIKVFTPTNDYVKVYTNQFSQVLNIYPERVWGSAVGIKKLLSRFSNQTAYRVDRKTNREDFISSINPFIQIKDSVLVTLNSSLRNTFFFNRTNSVFGADLSWNDNRNKTLLTSGFDSRKNIYQTIRLRWNISKAFLLNLNYTDGRKGNTSEFFSNRNYEIHYFDAEPKLSYQTGTSFRISILYKKAQKNNSVLYGGEKLQSQTFGTEMKYNVLAKGNLLLNVNYILNKYDSGEMSLLSFEMLEGLQPGKNITWNLSYNRNLSNNTQLTINYIGRTSENTPTVHTGGVQVRAFF